MRWDRGAIILVGLGYGDEGKGTWTDYLARAEPVHTVVRFNGGAQAGHNVVLPDGRHHTFAQLGSGSFVRGVNTHLSRFMLLNPFRLLREADALAGLGVPGALERVSVDRRALVTTPFQVAANRLRELARGDGRHGSCGMGIGETMADWLEHGPAMVTAGDLAEPATLRRKLRAVRDLKLAQLGEVLAALPETPSVAQERRILDDPGVIERSVETYADLAGRVRLVDDSYLGTLLDLAGTVLFEGAQGVLLDEWRGLHPYTTWSTTTFANAETLLSEAGYDGAIVKLGLLRAYQTRHGAGPFVTEAPELRAHFTDPYNVTNDWQQGLRVGPFDAVAARYAVEVAGRPDLLAVSHLDQLAAAPAPRIATAYHDTSIDPDVGALVDTEDGLIVRLRPSPVPEDLGYQERLTRLLAASAPVYRAAPRDAAGFVAAVEDVLGIPVALTSAGPTWQEKSPRGPWRPA